MKYQIEINFDRLIRKAPGHTRRFTAQNGIIDGAVLGDNTPYRLLEQVVL